MTELTSSNSNFFEEIRSILSSARSKAATAVNTAMVEAYWHIGQRIVEEEQEGQAKATYGARLLEELSRHLTDQFGKGFSVANLRNFRQFYLTYPDPHGIHYTLCSELSWSHNRLIMRENDEQAQLYYLRQAKLENWSVRQLQRQLKTQSYQRLLSSGEVTPESKTAPTITDIRSLIKETPTSLNSSPFRSHTMNQMSNQPSSPSSSISCSKWGTASPSSPARCGSAPRPPTSFLIWCSITMS